MLEGKELEKEFDGGAGKVSVDVDDKGHVTVAMSYKKDVVAGVAVQNETGVQLDLVVLMALAAEKSGNAVVLGLSESLAKALGR